MNPLGRIMPDDKASEAALLGSLLLEPGGIGNVVEHLTEEAFYRVENRIVYGALLRLYEQSDRGNGIDLVLVRDELRRKGQLEDAGGVPYLESLAQSVPSAANRDYYMQVVLRHAARRGIIQESTNALNAAYSDQTDTSDLLAKIEELGKYAEKKQKTGTSAEAAALIEASAKGHRVSLQLPWPNLQLLSRALTPGTTTLLCGGPGAAKSLMLLQIFGSLMDVPSAIYELEETRAYHLLRALAQESGRSQITDCDWVMENAEEARGIYEEHESFVENLAARIWMAEKDVSLQSIALWVECRIREGRKLLAIDPITMASHTTREPWNEDKVFINRVKNAVERNAARLIIVTHPTKDMTVSLPDMNRLWGGAAWSRFPQTVIWLEAHPIKTSTVLELGYKIDRQHSRTVHILKARNAGGAFSQVAYSFDGEYLALNECGLIIKTDKKGTECPTTETSGFTKPKRSRKKSENLSTTNGSEGESVPPISETKSPLCSDVSPKRTEVAGTPTLVQESFLSSTGNSSRSDALARRLASPVQPQTEQEGGPNDINWVAMSEEARQDEVMALDCAEEEANQMLSDDSYRN